MLDIYVMFFSKEYFVSYNTPKTVAICCDKSGGRLQRSLHLNGPSIRWETPVEYLGNMDCSSMSDCNEVAYKKHIYITSVNKLNCHFAFASSGTIAKLLQTYCSAWHGSQNWQLNTEALRGFHSEWNKAVLRTLGFRGRIRTDCFDTLLISDLSRIKFSTDWSSFVSACYMVRMRRCNMQKDDH